MKTVFIDESGYTGPDLMNPDQPVFALASHNFTEEEAKTLKSRFFGNVQAKELKSTSLMKRAKSQRMIVDFITELRQQQERSRIAYMHKPYAMLCKSVDWIVEPAMRRKGVNLNERGGNLAMCNAMYFMLQSDQEYRFRMLNALQHFMSEPNRATFATACDVLAERTGIAPQLKPGALSEILQHLYFGILFMHRDDIAYLGKENLDLCFSLALKMMGSWGKQLGKFQSLP